ncbi:MAG: hypothetical protein AM326_04290 [Candidatus Thorarchaeota archaeon SMTZ-45]|nr:MAG: hypothetical protein AM326_04290 [Candidatus Thorarchaeota archaeon SMTZ-45]KXH74518.1 MAG: hypothetical protein AM325_05950 [Candidatus Thorarchaeota archaeon SMTZ1-45]
MIDFFLLLFFGGGVLIAFLLTRKGTRSTLPRKQEHIMLYSPGSRDIGGEAYYPGEKDGAMPFPVGKKKERKKTETFRQNSKD